MTSVVLPWVPVAHLPSFSLLSKHGDSAVTCIRCSSALLFLHFHIKAAPIFVPYIKRSVGLISCGYDKAGAFATADNAKDCDGNPEAEHAQHERKSRIKFGEIIAILNKRAIEESEGARTLPVIRTGDIVEVKMANTETKRRYSVYKGIVISRRNAGFYTSIRIRNVIAGVGVEIAFPVYSPKIKEIKVIGHRRVRRAKLYYLRDKLPRFSTFK